MISIYNNLNIDTGRVVGTERLSLFSYYRRS